MLTDEGVLQFAKQVVGSRTMAMEDPIGALEKTIKTIDSAVDNSFGEYIAIVHRFNEGVSEYCAYGEGSRSLAVDEIANAFLYIARARGVALEPNLGASQNVHLFFNGEVISHTGDLKKGTGPLTFGDYQLWIGAEQHSNSPDDLSKLGIHLFPGYKATESLLQKMGLKGNMEKDLSNLYGQMSKQKSIMEPVVMDLFFKRGY
jgi:hypothetical protein